MMPVEASVEGAWGLELSGEAGRQRGLATAQIHPQSQEGLRT